jgi:hypothetical protein
MSNVSNVENGDMSTLIEFVPCMDRTNHKKILNLLCPSPVWQTLTLQKMGSYSSSVCGTELSIQEPPIR